MRRRDVLAGLGSAGVLAGAGAVAAFGIPSGNDTNPKEGEAANESDESDDGSGGLIGRRHEPYEIETVDAPGSEAGTIQVPPPNEPLFIDFFGTWCDPCIKQMDALGAAHERVGDQITFLSVTHERVGQSLTEDELVAWWDEHDGHWTLGLDPTVELGARYWGTSYPTAVAIDASGRVRWHETGPKTADELVAGIERALDGEDEGEGDESNATEAE
ncbi:TlpA family protein disulfide reductase [Natrinema salifodinae]|uniref:Thiol-disulfide isomerase or thioredoxin n=1 Tax=Natrinema salifodinae TaxID=1202768 RepID=A0A1I0M1L4_9EURY|nr:TlpA disulfide reductase family protein [Natrinema salifodinae]SEV82243.1 Thiol-disulfide isomerase or thioredoxin [Natrinema salifodinae]